MRIVPSLCIAALALSLYTIINHCHIATRVHLFVQFPPYRANRLPSPCIQIGAIFSFIKDSTFSGEPLCSQYDGVSVSNQGTYPFHQRYGPAIEGFMEPYAAWGEWFLVIHDVSISVGSACGLLLATERQAYLIAALESLGCVSVIVTRPHCNVGLNTILIYTKVGQTLVAWLIVVASIFHDKWFTGLLYWFVVAVEALILLMTLALPSINEVSQLVVFAFSHDTSADKRVPDVKLGNFLAMRVAIKGDHGDNTSRDRFGLLLWCEIWRVTCWWLCFSDVSTNNDDRRRRPAGGCAFRIIEHYTEHFRGWRTMTPRVGCGASCGFQEAEV